MRRRSSRPTLEVLESRRPPSSLVLAGADPLPDPEPSPGPDPGLDTPVVPPPIPPSGPIGPGTS